MSAHDANGAPTPEVSEAERQILIIGGTLAARGWPTDRSTLEAFGRDYFGMFRATWSAEGYAAVMPGDRPDAFRLLVERGWLRWVGEAAQLTAESRPIADALMRAHPKSGYFYDEFYLRIPHSRVHAEFCSRVYGSPLGQHGMMDAPQLARLVEVLRAGRCDHLLELGCGDGRVAERIAEQCGARVTGIERSAIAVANALARTAGSHDRLDFRAAPMEEIDFPVESFDAVVAVDSLYFVADLPGYVARLKRWLAPDGRLVACYSVWLPEGESTETLRADETKLAQALRANGLGYEAEDWTAGEVAHWRRKLAVARELREAFAAEGHDFLGRWLLVEAEQHQQYVDSGRLARYLYVAG
jgi:SAM-dependent methyltransferase